MKEFKGTKGKWFVDFNETDKNEFNQLVTPISTILDGGLKVLGICDVYGDDIESKANAKLIASAPALLEEHKNEIEFLKRIKKQLDDAGASMEYEVEERIEFLKQLCLEIVNL
jgi:hypothetical protein